MASTIEAKEAARYYRQAVQEMASAGVKAQKRERVLRKILLAVAPRGMKKWLREVPLLDVLFAYGCASDKILYSEQRGALSTENGAKKLLQAWARAAGGAIKIEVDTGETHRLQYRVFLA